MPDTGCLSTEETWTFWWEYNKGYKNSSHIRKLWRGWNFSEKWILRGILLIFINTWMKDENMTVRLSLVVPSDRSRRNGSKLKHRTSENTFYSDRDKGPGTGFAEMYRVFLPWNTENLSGRGLKHPALCVPAWTGELYQMTPRSPFQLQPVCDSMKVLYLVQKNSLQQPNILLL